MPHRFFLFRWFDGFASWFKSEYEKADHDLLTVAYEVTNAVKDALNSGSADLIADITPTKLDNTLLAVAREKLPLIMAAELALKDITPATTDDEAKAIAQQIADSFGGIPDERKGQFYTSVFANLYKTLIDVRNGQKITFGLAASFAETTWHSYQLSKQEPATSTP